LQARPEPVAAVGDPRWWQSILQAYSEVEAEAAKTASQMVQGAVLQIHAAGGISERRDCPPHQPESVAGQGGAKIQQQQTQHWYFLEPRGCWEEAEEEPVPTARLGATREAEAAHRC
jgi:hypothetical protein